jgi:hypothetical protein
MLDQREKRELKGVVGVSAWAEHSAAHAKNHRSVTADQLGEGIGVAARGTTQKDRFLLIRMGCAHQRTDHNSRGHRFALQVPVPTIMSRRTVLRGQHFFRCEQTLDDNADMKCKRPGY